MRQLNMNELTCWKTQLDISLRLSDYARTGKCSWTPRALDRLDQNDPTIWPSELPPLIAVIWPFPS
jgi:hypothetical protein